METMLGRRQFRTKRDAETWVVRALGAPGNTPTVHNFPHHDHPKVRYLVSRARVAAPRDSLDSFME